MANVKEELRSMLPAGLSNSEIVLNDLHNELRKLLAQVKRYPENLQSSLQSQVTEKIKRCASMGIAPNTIDGLCTLYISKEWTGRDGKYHEPEVVYMLGYKGQVRLCSRYGWTFMPAVLVYEGDDLSVEIDNGVYHIKHAPQFKSKKISSGYCVATDGRHTVTTFCSASEIDAARKKSRTPDKGPWAEFPEDMAKKTLVGKTAKQISTLGYLPDILDVEDDELEEYDSPSVNEPSDVFFESSEAVSTAPTEVNPEPEPEFPEPDFPEQTETQVVREEKPEPKEQKPSAKKANHSEGAQMFSTWAKNADLTDAEKKELWEQYLPVALEVSGEAEARKAWKTMTVEQAKLIIDGFEQDRG